ncbi:flagellar protein FlbD [Lachnospiraceae bacterium KM106-2]|nr:flagellar protein FlbD [Lachnospiraceae bacterium KM106-2]
MIDLTKLNNQEITINAELIQSIEETPDTTITLTTGKVLVVRESRQTVKDLVVKYKHKIYGIPEQN